MWTVENRARHDRSKLRYPSDLTDEEWALAKTEVLRAKQGGNKRAVGVRGVMTGLMYVLSTGCQWRAMPKDLPPRSTVTTTSADGSTTARSTSCTMRFTCSAASRWTARAARQRRSSTARASRALRKGTADRSAGF